MPGTLNIPLEGQITTRRDYARVVALYSSLGLGLLLAIVAWRLQYVVSPTLRYQPKETVMSVHLLVTPKNKRVVGEHLAEFDVLPGSPLTLEEVMNEAKREVTIDVGIDGAVSYVIDNTINDEVAKSLASFGYEASRHGGTTVVAKTGSEIADTGRHLTIRALWPWFQGDVVSYGANASRVNLYLNDKGLSIRGTDVAADDALLPTIAEGTTVLANVTVAANSLQLPAMMADLLPIPADSKALQMLLENGGSIMLVKDEAGVGYYLSFDPGEMTVDEAAALGKDMMNRASLSTQEWTTPDGSSYEELRSQSLDIKTDIRAEETYTFITLTNKAGDTLRIAKTPNLLTVANREISLDNGVKPASTCLADAHTWFTTSLITEALPATLLNNNRAAALFLQNFKEVAINNGETRFCW